MNSAELKQKLTEARKAIQLEINDGETAESLMKGLGLTRTNYYKFLNGSYIPKKPAIIKTILDWHTDWKLEQDSLSYSQEEDIFVETETSRSIYSDLVYAHDFQDIVLIFGGAGIGKTTTIRQYSKENNATHLIECTPNNATKGGILRAISRSLGLHCPRGNTDLLEQLILKDLTKTKSLLIFDEAQFLSLTAIETIRRLHDESEIGIALAGNERVRDQMVGTRNSQDFAQLFSRVGKFNKLNKPKKADVIAILSSYNIAENSSDTLFKISQKAGALRILKKVIRMASIFAKNQQIENKHILVAWGNLSGTETI